MINVDEYFLRVIDFISYDPVHNSNPIYLLFLLVQSISGNPKMGHQEHYPKKEFRKCIITWIMGTISHIASQCEVTICLDIMLSKCIEANLSENTGPQTCRISQSLAMAAISLWTRSWWKSPILVIALYPTGRKLSLEFKFCFFVNGKFAKFKFH